MAEPTGHGGSDQQYEKVGDEDDEAEVQEEVGDDTVPQLDMAAFAAPAKKGAHKQMRAVSAKSKRNLLRDPVNLVPHLEQMILDTKAKIAAIDVSEANDDEMAELLDLKGSLNRQTAQLAKAEAKLEEVHRQKLLMDSTVQEAQVEERELAQAGINVVLDTDISKMDEDEEHEPDVEQSAEQAVQRKDITEDAEMHDAAGKEPEGASSTGHQEGPQEEAEKEGSSEADPGQGSAQTEGRLPDTGAASGSTGAEGEEEKECAENLERMQIEAAAVSSPASGVEVTVVGTEVKTPSQSQSRSPSVAAMTTHDEEQERTTNMGFIFTADHRIREHARITRRMAQIQTNINQAELNAKLLERRTARFRAGSPIIRSAASLEEPIGGLAPQTNPEAAPSSSASASTKPAEQQPPPPVEQQQQQQDPASATPPLQPESSPTFNAPGSQDDEPMTEPAPADAPVDGAAESSVAGAVEAGGAQVAAASTDVWGGWHEVTAGGLYNTDVSNVVVNPDVSKVPEVN